MKLSLVLRDRKNALKLSKKTLENFVERIKTDTKDEAVARRRRLIQAGGDAESYDSQIPSHLVYPSVEFGRDANDNLQMQAFNGIVALTVDGLSGQKDLEAVKQAAKILHYTLAAFVGPEGDEVIILVRIARNTTAGTPADDTTMTEEEADALCREGWQLASALYQVVLPKAVRQEEVTLRSCFRMPLDPSPYVNLKALALPVSERPICQQQAGGAPKVVTETADDSDVSRETQQLMDFLNSRYEFRYNDMMGYTEYRSKGKRYADWQPVDDRSLKGLTMEVRLGGIDVRDNDVRRYVHSNMIRAYDPIGDYLWARHGKWDGQDHIRRLARTVPTKNPYWQDWFYTWFLGMVRQWRVSSIAKYGNQAVPLLISTQGWNKTTFCEQLLPPELSWGYTGNLQLDDKRQVLQQMAQMLLINLDEFNQISPRKQQGFLKNILQLPAVKVQRPYARHVEDIPRLASFIATTNQADVLADPSGSRRFIGIYVTSDIDTHQTPNYPQLFAQAKAELDDDARYWFDAAETEELMRHNLRFQQRSDFLEFFFEYFAPGSDEASGEWMTAAALLAEIKKRAGAALKVPPTVNKFARELRGLPDIQVRRSHSSDIYLVSRK